MMKMKQRSTSIPKLPCQERMDAGNHLQGTLCHSLAEDQQKRKETEGVEEIVISGHTYMYRII